MIMDNTHTPIVTSNDTCVGILSFHSKLKFANGAPPLLDNVAKLKSAANIAKSTLKK